jgi:hypothetical protein
VLGEGLPYDRLEEAMVEAFREAEAVVVIVLLLRGSDAEVLPENNV